MHVLDLLLGDQLGEQLLGVAGVISREELSHLANAQITLEVDHDVLAEVLDKAIHGIGLSQPVILFKASTDETDRGMLVACPASC